DLADRKPAAQDVIADRPDGDEPERDCDLAPVALRRRQDSVHRGGAFRLCLRVHGRLLGGPMSGTEAPAAVGLEVRATLAVEALGCRARALAVARVAAPVDLSRVVDRRVVSLER